MAKLLQIGEVSRRAGLAASALRYYESQGLIEPAGRQGLTRLYRPSVLDRLAGIVAAKCAGFSLTEIRMLFEARKRNAELLDLLRSKADELDNRIVQLALMRDGLRHALRCRHSRLIECPRFLSALRSLASRQGVR